MSTNVRTEFHPEESIDSKSLQTIMEANKVFLGSIHGFALTKRGPNDDHIILTLLTVDDEHWRVSDGMNVYSSAWIEEEIELLNEVKKWCEENCTPETVFNGKQYGWRFK